MEDKTFNGTTEMDEVFVKNAYQNNLNRLPSEIELSNTLNALTVSGPTFRMQFLWDIYNSAEATANRKHLREVAEFVAPGHFYSAIPDKAAKKEALENKKHLGVNDIRLNVRDQQRMLESFKKLWDECKFPTQGADGWRYYYENGAYSWTDGFVLYAMMRTHKPSQIIEVGSGHSSAAMLDTREYYGLKTSFTFIEPYPELLKSLLKPDDLPQTTLLSTRVQDVPLDVFKKLNQNDILFIDSTHVSKLRSDVNYLFFQVLPILKKGVVIHIHDIFYPFEYPKAWIKEGRVWNELYLLRAFLMNNKDYKVMFFNHFAHQKFRKWIVSNMPELQYNSGGGFWMRKNVHPSKKE